MPTKATDPPDQCHLRRLLEHWRTMDYIYGATPMMIPERRRKILERWIHSGVIESRRSPEGREYRWADQGDDEPKGQANRTWVMGNLRAAAEGYKSLEALRAANPGAAESIERRGFTDEIFGGVPNEQ